MLFQAPLKKREAMDDVWVQAHSVGMEDDAILDIGKLGLVKMPTQDKESWGNVGPKWPVPNAKFRRRRRADQSPRRLCT